MPLVRGRSKDRERKVTPPGPVYMSNSEFGEYLKSLRENRVSRPAGARPPPASKRRESDRGEPQVPTEKTAESQDHDAVPRPASVLSHKRAQPSFSAYSSATSRTGRQLVQQPVVSQGTATPILKPSEVVPSATYMERGQRWMEKEEAVSLREAMEDMDLKTLDEEARIHEAAQREASELVWRHEYPDASIKPDEPYRYNDHLRKNSYQHARTQSVGRYGGIGMATGLARDMAPRSVSGGSSSSGGIQSPRSRVSSDSSDAARLYQSPEPALRPSIDSMRQVVSKVSQKSYGSVGRRTSSGSRRKSSLKRNVSGEVSGTFTGEQIWEEPEQDNSDRGRPKEGRDMPAPLRLKARNPLNRVQFVQDTMPRSNSTPPEPIKRLSTYEIHKNPPSQSRNPLYVANPPPAEVLDEKTEQQAPPVPMKDGLEIRSDDIRKATSMRLKDRSPKLPTPTAVSDKAGRPIVSFDANWKPNEADTKPEVRRRSPFDRRFNPPRSDSAPVPAIQVSDSPSVQVRIASTIPAVNLPKPTPSIPTNNFPNSYPPIPAINRPQSRPSIPTISFPDSAPCIPQVSVSAPGIPSINVSSTEDHSTRPLPPQISVSAPTIPTISIGSSDTRSQRPLPMPDSAAARRSFPASRGHWSPAAGRRATATCHQCQLPIEGRVVKLSGAAEHFHPECFICFCCGTGLESLEIHPEPSATRGERVDRIQRRAGGEPLEEIEGQTMAEDGDERQRYYCHLDFHENFAPKCKHCKTPIIGEHTVALGEHWHYGHFFCAECGDPFEKGMTHIEKDGYAWCLNCQTKRTERQAPKCKKCKKPVIGEYVQALGGEWHDKCFRCATCNHGFADGAFYPKEVGNETVVLCIQCIERELKA